MSRIRLLTFALVAAVATQAYAGGYVCWMAELQRQGTVDEYAAELRAKGPQGLEEALGILAGLNNQTRVKTERVQIGKADSDAQWSEKERLARKAIRRLIDQVAGQRDAHISRLYWYTNLDEAKASAEESGKPILSLRMLGKLTDEYSCANSRFFRTALYSNKEISDYLRDNYVLHWQSVRPVPRVTVDFGDGRKLERTVTGNSAHYVLDSAGRPVEALPGLYGPKAFQVWLVRSKELANRLSLVSDNGYRANLLVEHHANRRNAVDEALRADLASFAPELLRDEGALTRVSISESSSRPTARQAGFRAMAKGQAESPLVAPFVPSRDTLEAQGHELWRRIAAAHANIAKLDEASVALIREENPTAAEAGTRAITKSIQEDPLVRLLRNFEEAMALDTVKNEYILHRKIHEWFVNGAIPVEIDAFNELVYSELFLTPSSDPWLGLAPASVYTALDGGGLTAARLSSDR
jgi:hypothetical protein